MGLLLDVIIRTPIGRFTRRTKDGGEIRRRLGLEVPQ